MFTEAAFAIAEILDDLYSLVYCILFYVIIIIVCLPAAYVAEACKSYVHIGPIHACNVFEIFNFIIFFTLIILLISCSELGWSSLFPETKKMISQYRLIPLVIIYIVLIIGASFNYPSFQVYAKIVSKQEAVNLINRKLRAEPNI